MGDDFQAALARVTSSLVTMAKAVREAMRQASAALLTSNPTLAQQVTVRATEIEVLYRVVDDRVFDLIVRRQPVAEELHTALTALQAAADLERMGALASHVARATLRRHPTAAVAPELTELFRAMSKVSDELAGKIVAALAGSDATLAAQLDGDDDAMDQLHRQLFSVMLRPDWPLGVESAIDGALLGRYYERFADHAVNVSQHVMVLVDGKNA